ncbi:hypothetical protein BKA93DRAFT_748605 [Sparassis latifolia]
MPEDSAITQALFEPGDLGYDAAEGMPIEPAPAAEVDAIPEVTTRSGRRLHVPKGLADYLPQPFRGIPVHIHRPPQEQRVFRPYHGQVDTLQGQQDPTAEFAALVVENVPTIDTAELSIKTELNEFGLYHVYSVKPQKDPEDETILDSLCNSPMFITAPETTLRGRNPLHHLRETFTDTLQSTRDNFFTLFLNVTTYRLLNWMYGTSDMKSISEVDSLIHNVLLADDFDANHLQNFSAEEDDYGYDISDNEEYEEGTGDEGIDHEEEDLGPENGEDGEEDEYGDEGYAPL